jgi:hypothetical protein
VSDNYEKKEAEDEAARLRKKISDSDATIEASKKQIAEAAEKLRKASEKDGQES